MSTPVVDAWIQHPTPRLLEQPYFESLKRWLGRSLDQLPLETTLDALRAAGVSRALVSAWYAPGGPLISNLEVRAQVAAAPDLLVGIAGADLRQPLAAVRALREAILEHGFKGVRILQWLWDLPPTHPLYYPIYTVCAELKVPICLQVGLTGPLCTSETGRPHHIERVALDFPDLTIVCGHIGYPWQQEMIAYATKFPHVYIDTSAYKPRRYPPELVAFLKTHGRHKVLFGSNYPMLTPEQCLAELDSLGLEPEVRELFLFRNATRVFGL